MEEHHVRWLAKGGGDSIGNTIELCPNCHRKMHVLDLVSDKDVLLGKIANHMVNKGMGLINRRLAFS